MAKTEYFMKVYNNEDEMCTIIKITKKQYDEQMRFFANKLENNVIDDYDNPLYNMYVSIPLEKEQYTIYETIFNSGLCDVSLFKRVLK